jgi:hypothetical protein
MRQQRLDVQLPAGEDRIDDQAVAIPSDVEHEKSIATDFAEA